MSRWLRRCYSRDRQHIFRARRRVLVWVDPFRVPPGSPPPRHRSAPGRQRQCGRGQLAAEHHKENRRQRDGTRRRQGNRERARRATDRSGHNGTRGCGDRRGARSHLSRVAWTARRQRCRDDVRRVFDSRAASDRHRDIGLSRARVVDAIHLIGIGRRFCDSRAACVCVRRARGHSYRRDPRRCDHRAPTPIEFAASVCGHRAETRTKRMKTVAVLGSGSWGTALAFHLASAGHDVRLWGRNAELIEEMKVRRANAVYLPDIVLPAGVVPTASLDEALRRADIVVAALPSHGTRAVIRSAAPFISRQALIVSATKGIEQDTLLRVSEVIAQEVRGARPVAVLSGPSFAIEVARRLPTAVSVACVDPVLAEDVQREFRAAYFRLYGSTDVIGVEIGGALKNIIAIAAGVVEGLGLGQNALAALITRGLAEITRLACALGGRRETLAGLSGLGDLVLTCTGSFSRNRHVGVELAHGRPISEVVAGMKMVAEGVKTTSAALALGRKHGVELPIATQMAEVLAGHRSAAAAVEELMLRPQKTEVT